MKLGLIVRMQEGRLQTNDVVLSIVGHHLKSHLSVKEVGEYLRKPYMNGAVLCLVFAIKAISFSGV